MKPLTLLLAALFLTPALAKDEPKPATAAATAGSASGFAVGQKMPALGGYGLAGAVPETKGKVVLLDFWASWCAPCKKSFPVLEKWHKASASKGLVVLAVSVDEEAGDMDAFLKKAGVSFATARDAAQKLVAAAGASTMPTSILIDKKGVVQLVHSGFKPADEAALAKKIDTLLAEK